ncbi:hypothetical protein JW998_01085, partial [candidate division KSB1 bacterium]|nr:hypothetical protein [candidate division KSB1 bacterium]
MPGGLTGRMSSANARPARMCRTIGVDILIHCASGTSREGHIPRGTHPARDTSREGHIPRGTHP